MSPCASDVREMPDIMDLMIKTAKKVSPVC